jgi:hypothetical protein
MNLYELRYVSKLDVALTENIIAETLEKAVERFRITNKQAVIISVALAASNVVLP